MEKQSKFRKGASIDMLCITLLWLASLGISNPNGDFPLNDDWSYGLAVKHLLEDGYFSPTGWTSMPLITNVLWGLLFCVPKGFSFVALRISTLVLSLAGALATYILIRELHQARWLAAFASLTLAFTPIYYALSHTFMTDVPFTAMIVISGLFFMRNLNTGSTSAMVIATAFSVAATLSRQLGICVPLGFAIASIIKTRLTKRKLLTALVPTIYCIAALVVFRQLLKLTCGLPALYEAKTKILLSAIRDPKSILLLLGNLYAALLYLGWFLLPVTMATFGQATGSTRVRKLLLGFSSLAMAAGAVSIGLSRGFNGLVMPIAGNVIVKSGIGPLTLYDTFLLKLNNKVELPANFWLAITAMSFVGAILLITTLGLALTKLVEKVRSSQIESETMNGTLFLLTALIYLVPILGASFRDRYLIPAIPFLMAGITGFLEATPEVSSRVARILAVVFLCFASFFAICATRDYLAWNRARWQAINDLIENQKVQAKDIDGGFEFNGWHAYETLYKKSRRPFRLGGDIEYRVGFGAIPGYKMVKEFEYDQFLPPHKAKIVVLKKDYAQNNPKSD